MRLELCAYDHEQLMIFSYVDMKYWSNSDSGNMSTLELL